MGGNVLLMVLTSKRIENGWTQGDIADVLKWSQSKVSKFENGRDNDTRIGDFRSYGCAVGFHVVLDIQ